MLYKAEVFVRVIVLLYPQTSQLLLSTIIVGYQVKNSKRTNRTKELGIIITWSLVLIFS